MITFSNWTIRNSGDVLARQYDHLSRTLLVSGVPDGYSWRMLVRAGGSGEYFDIIALFPMENGVGAVLTRDQLSVSGDYEMQLQGTLKADGETVCHSNTILVNIPPSMTGDAKWPAVPSEFKQLEQRVQAQADMAEESSNTAVSAMNTAVEASNTAVSAKEAAVKAQLNATTAESMAKASAEAAAASAAQAAESAGSSGSGGNGGNIFVAAYGVTTIDEIYTAYQAGKAVFCNYNGMLASLYTIERTDEAVFLYHTDAGMYSISADPSGWSYEYRSAVDTTLSKSGKAADSAAVGARLSSLSEEIANKLNGGVTASSPEDGEVFIVVDDSGEVVDPDPEDSRTVLHNFDFTQGLTDSVSGVNAVLAGTATQDADGVHFYAGNDQLKLMFVVSPSTHIEYDLKSAELTMSSHGRLLTFTTSADAAGSSAGLLWRSGYGWSFYTKSGWGPTINDEEKTCMSGKKLTLSFDVDLVASLYVDGVFWAKAPTTFCTTGAAHYAFIGSSSGGQSAYPMTISAIRVYDGEYGGES